MSCGDAITKQNELLASSNFGDEGRYNTILLNYWTPESPTNAYPANRPATNLGLPVGFYENASFVRLKDVSLAYQVPSRVARRIGAGTLRLYVDGRNLWTSTKWTGLDPEFGSQYGVPQARTIIGGLDVSF